MLPLTPSASGLQFVPFHMATLVAFTPPIWEKSPAKYIAPLGVCFITQIGPLAPGTPSALSHFSSPVDFNAPSAKRRKQSKMAVQQRSFFSLVFIRVTS